MQRITAFTDCDSESIVIRLPYELLVQIVKILPQTDMYSELRDRINIAAHRSNKLTRLLNDI